MWIELLLGKFQVFLLILMRLMGMIWVAPFFSSYLIPMRVKLILGIMVSIVMFPMVSVDMWGGVFVGGLVEYIGLIVKELLVGLSIGLMMSIIFGVFQLAGQFFSVQMGFGINEVLDPVSQSQVPLMGQFLVVLGTLVFLWIGGGELMIRVIFESYEKIPVLGFEGLVVGGVLNHLVLFFSLVFSMALKLSLPIVGVLLIVTLALGVLARFAPQMNILILGFPIYILVGLTVLTILIPEIVVQSRWYLLREIEKLFEVF